MERPAFDRLLTAYLPRVMGIAERYAARYNLRHEWQDIAQAALLKMLRFADYYDPGKEFMPWACVVIVNVIKSRLVQIAAAPDTAVLTLITAEQTRTAGTPESDLQAAFILDNLNEETRLHIEGYTYDEIAAQQGVRSKSTVNERINKCIGRLSKILGVNVVQKRMTRNVLKTAI